MPILLKPIAPRHIRPTNSPDMGVHTTSLHIASGLLRTEIIGKLWSDTIELLVYFAQHI